MKRKIISILLCAIPLTMSMTGCSLLKPNVEKILTKSNQVVEKAEDIEGTFVMDMEVTAESDGTSMSMGVSADTDLEVDQKDEISHMDGSMSVSVLGMSQDVDFEMYADPDMTYSCIDGEWTASESDTDDFSIGTFNVDALKEVLTLEEDQKDGCFVLTGETDIDELSELTGDLMDLDSLMSNAGLKDAEVEIEILIDAKSYAPVSQTFTMDFDVEDDTISDATLDLTITFDDLEADLDLEIPDEALDADETQTTSDNPLDSIFGSGSEPETMPETESETTGETGVEPETDPSNSATLVDYDGVERVRFDFSSPYSVSADEWGCSVYTDNSEGYDIASISYYDYSSYEDQVEDSLDYYSDETISISEERTADNGMSYYMIVSTDSYGDTTYTAIAGNDVGAFEVTAYSWWMEDFGLNGETVMHDIVSGATIL